MNKMSNSNKFVLKSVAKLAKSAARRAYGAASFFDFHQPKENDSSTYVNYATRADHTTPASGPYKFKCYVYGSDTSTSGLVDLSSYDQYGNARPDAVVTRGSIGYIYQLIHETFGDNAYAQLYGGQYQSYTGTAKGCWSSDSVGSGIVYNA